MGGRALGFVGRARELATLNGLLADAASGRCRIAIVEGEPGIGKTRLVQEALVAGRHFRVIDAFLELVEETAIERPVVVWIDDVTTPRPHAMTNCRGRASMTTATSALPCGDRGAGQNIRFRHCRLEARRSERGGDLT